MTGRSESGKTPRQAQGAASPGSGCDQWARTPGLAQPADLDRSLRLLDDAQFDRLAEAVADGVRRRGRSPLEPGRRGRRAHNRESTQVVN